jgi:hypothetical protein
MAHLVPAIEGECFTYVRIPADITQPIEERSESAEGGLEDDKLIKCLKSGSEIGPMVDIVALTVPMAKTNYTAVSIYQNGNPGNESLEVNKRIMGLMDACGLKSKNEIRGDVFLSRYVDDDNEIWKRVNFKIEDCSSDALWVKESAKLNIGRSVSGSSLSSILANQAAAAANANANGGQQAAVLGEKDVAFDALNINKETTEGDKETCFWTQTPDEIEGVSVLPTGITKKDVKVKFLPTRLEVSYNGVKDVKLTGDLGGNVDLDGCTWNFDGKGNIVVSMEKKQSGSKWPFALRQD